MKEYLSIKEFSQLSGIETTTLRYWDEVGVFSPAIRDPQNNYRYYSPQQVIAANFITVMSSLNIPLKTIAEAEDKRDPAMIVQLIEQQEKNLDREMNRLRECYSIIHTRRELINYGMQVDDSEIRVQWLDEAEIIFGPPSEFKEGNTFYEPFMKFCRQAKDLRINTNLPIGGYHEDMESFLRAPGQPQRFYSRDPTGNSKREAGEYLIGFTRGDYGQFDEVAQRLAAYAEEHSLVCSGPVYTMYPHDEICYKDPSRYLGLVAVALDRGQNKPKQASGS